MFFIDYLIERKINENFKKSIDEIFNTAVIEEVISEFVFKKTGANYKGLVLLVMKRPLCSFSH